MVKASKISPTVALRRKVRITKNNLKSDILGSPIAVKYSSW
jgi:hypothetical protein